MIAWQRHQEILEQVRKNGSVSVQTLVDILEASPATIRRDLTVLEEDGKVIRTHGAVVEVSSLSDEPSIARKQTRAPRIKERLGKRAAEQIPSGSSVYVDAGSTCLEAGKALLQRGDCTLFTNSLPLAQFAGTNPLYPLTVLGGEVRGWTGALVGPSALVWMNHLRFDVAVLGASSLDTNEGCFTTEMSEAAVKQAAAQHAEQVMILADQQKFQEKTPIRFLDWRLVHQLITDSLSHHLPIPVQVTTL
jgi:DeoR/GlpR family transcriptional regulator of sugar metabolism